MSWTEEDQQPEEKKLKLGIDDPFYFYDYDKEGYFKRLYDYSIEGDDDPNASDDDDEERDMTPEEAKLYFDALKASDGFDVPSMPEEVQQCGMILPKTVTEDSIIYLLKFSRAAIDLFNENYGTNYKVVEVVKAMHQGARGINYYITFLAKIDDDNNSDTTTTDADNSDTITTDADNSGTTKSDDDNSDTTTTVADNSGTTKSDDDNSDTTSTVADNSGTRVFEALVLMGIPEKKGDDATKVYFCREKGGRTASAVESDDEIGALEGDNGEGGSVQEAKGV